ncbi:hypothetical protein ALC56_09485 [Trachymyrmex septentrionalis]|uniref:DUF8207 domain-containing protein n=1 Tax=Trachymyrmex septentrionalis TaxID=34720 RepID=A0A151JUF9_9HYME|nr:hypothetical protein ALC56_09485 [Trachymyrmex septentrionalis]
MKDICVRPGGQDIVRPRQFRKQRSFLDFQPWSSSFFLLPDPVSRRHSDKMVGAASFYNSTVPSILNEMSEIIQPRDSSYDHHRAPFVEEIFEVAEGPLVTSNQHLLQTLEKQKKLHSNYGNYIIDGKRNDGTTGLYELIFMNFSNESICINDDEQTYEKVFC